MVVHQFNKDLLYRSLSFGEGEGERPDDLPLLNLHRSHRERTCDRFIIE
jgi:hypothetical protein